MSAARIRLAVAAAAFSLLVLAPGALAAGTVTVSVTGQGSATGQGINCTESGGPDCSEAYADIETEECVERDGKPPLCFPVQTPPEVTFTAGADSNGFAYDGWTGCDSVSNRVCGVTVTASRGVTARFRDAQAPSVTAPTPTSGVRRGTITLATTASDNAGVIKVEFYNGASKLGEDISSPYELAWNTTTVPDGAKSITAKAYDAAGYVTTSAASGFTVDNTAPSLTVNTGPNGQTFGPGSTQTWNYTAFDATSGVTTLCRVRSASSTPAFSTCGAASHSVSNLPDGSYTFEAFARDGGQLESALQSRTFAIDATPPETTIGSGPADGSSTTDTAVTFGFSAGQAGSTFQCRVYPAALTPPAFGACSAASAHTASGFSPGTYSFEVRATDPYGNTDASPAKRTFTVTAPGTDPGTGTGTDTGTGGGTTTTGGTTSTGGGTTSTGGDTTTTTTTTTTTVTTTVFDPRITSLFFYKGTRTRFTQLVISKLPKGSKVTASCKGKGCAFKKKAIPTAGAKLNVLGKLKRIQLRSGAVLQLKVTGPAGEQKIATWKIRTGKAPAMSYRCAPAGGKLGRCS